MWRRLGGGNDGEGLIFFFIFSLSRGNLERRSESVRVRESESDESDESDESERE